MTNLIAYHKATTDLALFESEGSYWIGSFDPFLSHQNSEPPYVLIDGYWTTEAEGQQRLADLRGDEF